MLSFVPEPAREHLVREALGECGADVDARLQEPVSAESEAIVVGHDDAPTKDSEYRVAYDDPIDSLQEVA
jgi:predicted  nucleic acid-binding Zn-ribbon protein